MPNRRCDLVAGAVDGVNATFQTPTDYRPGTLVALVNGAACVPTDVTAPGGVYFTLSQAPKVGSKVAARYTAVS